MSVVFFRTTGPLLIHALPSEATINAVYYHDQCLKSLVKKLCEQRPASTTNGIKLHHDNASPQMNSIVFDYLQRERINVMLHPPYSPDLAPSDYWLFGTLKRSLVSYPDVERVAGAITQELHPIPIEE